MQTSYRDAPRHQVRTIALVGAGGHGFHHLQEIRRAENLGEARLVAVAEPRMDQLTETAGYLSSRGVAVFPDDTAMLERLAEVDILVICTPVGLHEQMLKRALAHGGIGRILLEKPPLPTVSQMESAIASDTEERTRIGFHMIFLPEIQYLRNLFSSGQAGRLKRITISGGWPRSTAYYRRATWAGRMRIGETVIFDGPATNALAHLLQNAVHLAEAALGFPPILSETEGEFFRARRIESYDFAWLGTQMHDIRVDAALAHCLDEEVPWQMRFETEQGIITLHQNEGLSGTHITSFPKSCTQTRPVYQSLLLSDEAFRHEPTTLKQAIPYTRWTCDALSSSGGIHDVPDKSVRQEQDVMVGDGVASYLRRFPAEPVRPSLKLPWAADFANPCSSPSSAWLHPSNPGGSGPLKL